MMDRTCPNCQKVTDGPSFRCLHCRLLSQVTILFTGPVLSLKSVVAFYLHRRLRIGLIEAAYYGAVKPDGSTDRALTEKRRERVLEAALVFGRVGLAVIIDAAFHYK